MESRLDMSKNSLLLYYFNDAVNRPEGGKMRNLGIFVAA